MFCPKGGIDGTGTMIDPQAEVGWPVEICSRQSGVEIGIVEEGDK